MTALHTLTAKELSRLFLSGEVSAQEIARAFLDRIASVDGQVQAFLRTTEEVALEGARRVDERRSRGESLGPLAGVPVALKDNLATEGIETTAGSKILKGWIPPYTATAVRRLEAAGCPVLGKTNLDEFAMGSSTENSAYFPTRNPHDLNRVPGGSSGGSVAAVAALEAPLSLGSETGGSVRQPAAFCGVVGLKPTYGRVSRFGLIAFASSLDQIGPVGRTVWDVAAILQTISGPDENDMTASHHPVDDYLAKLEMGVQGLSFAMPEELLEGAQPAVREATLRAARALEQAGARQVQVTMANLAFGLAAYYVINPAEASSNLARLDGVRYGPRHGPDDLLRLYGESRGRGFGPEVKRRIMIGTFALSTGYYDAYYLKAQRVRSLIREDFSRAFQSADLILSPTTPGLPFAFGAHAGDPVAMYAEDAMTLPANLAGTPAISVPAGKQDGLPMGVQLIGRPYEEAVLFQAARVLEEALPSAPLDGVKGVSPGV